MHIMVDRPKPGPAAHMGAYADSGKRPSGRAFPPAGGSSSGARGPQPCVNARKPGGPHETASGMANAGSFAQLVPRQFVDEGIFMAKHNWGIPETPRSRRRGPMGAFVLTPTPRQVAATGSGGTAVRSTLMFDDGGGGGGIPSANLPVSSHQKTGRNCSRDSGCLKSKANVVQGWHRRPDIHQLRRPLWLPTRVPRREISCHANGPASRDRKAASAEGIVAQLRSVAGPDGLMGRTTGRLPAGQIQQPHDGRHAGKMRNSFLGPAPRR